MSAFGYVAVLVAGLALVVLGGEDLLLLVIGSDTTAQVTSSESHRSGRRGRSVQTTIQYAYAVDGVQYKGSGPWHGSTQPMQGDRASVRYLPFAAGVSAPSDALVGPGLLLVALGAGLIAVDYTFYKKRSRAAEDKPSKTEGAQGRKRARNRAA